MTRFDAYCDRKTDAAVQARIPGFISSYESSTTGHLVRIGNEWTHTAFDGSFYHSAPDELKGLPTISLVFVQSRDRNTEADDPSTLGGGETDKHLVYEGLSRVDADAVLAGATTAHADELVFSIWHPELIALRRRLGHPRHPTQVVMTARADLPIEHALLYNTPSLHVIVLTGSRGAARLRDHLRDRPWIEVIDPGEPLSLEFACRSLFARGIRVVSAIGGRRTGCSLLRAGLVSDLYLTTSAIAAGEPGTPLFGEPPTGLSLVLEKHGRDQEEGVRFQHFLVRE